MFGTALPTALLQANRESFGVRNWENSSTSGCLLESGHLRGQCHTFSRPGLTAFVASYKLLDGTETWRKEFEGAKSTKPDEFRGSWQRSCLFCARKSRLCSWTAAKVYALDPKTGDEIWSATDLAT